MNRQGWQSGEGTRMGSANVSETNGVPRAMGTNTEYAHIIFYRASKAILLGAVVQFRKNPFLRSNKSGP